jgi:peptide/nickel transport system permease protein
MSMRKNESNHANVRKKRNFKKASCLALMLIMLTFTFFGKFICPHDPYNVDVNVKFMGPSLEYPLGTDQLGRCVLSRIISGAKTSIGISLAIGILILGLGIFCGLVAGYFPGKMDFLILRLADFVMTLPSVLIAMAICSISGPSIVVLVVLLSAIWWGPTARYVRDLVREIKLKDYVNAARLNGLGFTAIAVHHILPSIFQKTLALILFKLPSIIISVASFSFLGLGPQAPTPDWGVMISDGRIYMSQHPFMILWPTLAFFVFILCLFRIVKIFSDN